MVKLGLNLDEVLVMLLGSVFDANSLGKWIYDWTVFHHGPGTPMSEFAGDLLCYSSISLTSETRRG